MTGPAKERSGAVSRGPLIAGVIAVLALFTHAFFANAWVCEDAYINFRSVEQLFAGNGPVWNAHERVQTFTSPLWYLVLAGTRLLSADLFFTTIAASFGLLAGTLLVSWRLLDDPRAWLLCVGLLLVSSAFFDFTTSGLEYPLVYFLLAVFLWACAAALRRGIDGARYARVVLVVSLLLVTRHDALVLVFVPAAWLSWRAWQRIGTARWLAITAAAASPFLICTLFATLYYGFPFPNSAYAKLNTGLARGPQWQNGWDYVVESLAWDPASAVLLLGALLAAAWRRETLLVCLAAGIVCSVLYTVQVGGDYMLGRFLAPAGFLGACTLALAAKPHLGWKALGGCAALLAAYVLVAPHSPLRSRFNDDPPSWGDTTRALRKSHARFVDAREMHFSFSSVRAYRSRDVERIFPDQVMAHRGAATRENPDRVTQMPVIGMFGYHAALETPILDTLALTDPLLARLPVSGPWRPGHFPRPVPNGYLESIESGEARIEHPELNEYYEHLRRVTQGPLLSAERLATLVAMNLGRYDRLIEAWVRDHPRLYPRKGEGQSP